ncbi:MAG: hypothetical protein C0522_09105 [Rhodocyclaceae bacterium]|jgi:biotin-dependent carboxylase-like uncharacterized protein|nr:hypothetical protein [Rhodocyclaceae bacterium]
MAVVIEVLEGSTGTTVQDAGRPGYRSYGVALSGALDPLGLACANALAGNRADAAALEMRLQGPHLRVVGGCLRVALAGPAEASVRRVEGRVLALPAWHSITLEDGDTLKAGVIRGGVAYLAVAGGIDTPPQLGSRATHLRAQIGGVEGRALRAGDRIDTGDRDGTQDGECRQAAFVHEGGPLRLMLGPQENHFTPDALRTLIDADFVVSRDADRMGIRLKGPQLAHNAAAGEEIVSDCVAPGALQVPPDGQPILLLADCQTVGGYPKIATVIRADLPRLAHLLPGDRLRFALVTRAQALSALREQRAKLESWLAGIAPYRPAGDIDEAALYSVNLISGILFDNGFGKGDEE